MCTAPSVVSGEEVVLKSNDGSTYLKGDLLSYDGEMFRLGTTIGTLQIAALSVECEGAACPSARTSEMPLRVLGGTPKVADLIGALVFGLGEEMNTRPQQRMISPEKMSFLLNGTDPDDPHQIVVASGDAAADTRALHDGHADMLIGSRLEVEGEDMAKYLLAHDAMVALVSPQSPRNALTLQDLSGVLRGTVTNWSELGGPDLRIVLAWPEDDPELMSALTARFGTLTEHGRRMSADRMADFVRRTPAAIGFSRYSNRRSAKPMTLVSDCGLVTAITDFTIRTGDYPLSLPVNLYHKAGGGGPDANSLIKFAMSREGRELISDAGLIAPGMATTGIDALGPFMISAVTAARGEAELADIQDLFNHLVGAERTSAVLRFDSGSYRINVATHGDLSELAADLAGRLGDHSELVIVGFTDEVEASQQRRDLARARSEAVRDGLLAAGLPENTTARIQTLAYEAIAPIGCNSDPEGRAQNRRVELWVRQAS
ncbi:phosphate ABC transporter substrate-binding/OmpA family protein [Algicella marina]|nr:phosphate ABC transporter substrate-binding/OmpA family protein [Algicella marina]